MSPRRKGSSHQEFEENLLSVLIQSANYKVISSGFKIHRINPDFLQSKVIWGSTSSKILFVSKMSLQEEPYKNQDNLTMDFRDSRVDGHGSASNTLIIHYV